MSDALAMARAIIQAARVLPTLPPAADPHVQRLARKGVDALREDYRKAALMLKSEEMRRRAEWLAREEA